MQQWILRAGTGIDNLKVEDFPIPNVGENEVLVNIHAAAVGPKVTLLLESQSVVSNIFAGLQCGHSPFGTS